MENKKEIVVLGAGIGGLAAGYFLAKTGNFHVTVLEKEPVVGGMCGSFQHDGFTLDYGAHKLYSVIPGILDEILGLMGDRLLKIPKKNRLFLKGRLVDYPLQMGNLAKTLGPGLFLSMGFGYGLEILKGLVVRKKPASYEEYIIRLFGRPAYELVFEPLADKVWGDPATLHSEMARTRVPSSGGLEIILKLLGIRKETAETNAAFFYYPGRGFGDFTDALKEKIEEAGGKVVTDANVKELIKEKNSVKRVGCLVKGKPASFECDTLVSAIPLPETGRLVFGDGNAGFNASVGRLQFRHLIIVYLFVKRPLVLEDQWIFFPEKQFVFSRIFEQKQMNPELGPGSRSSLCCDFTCFDNSWQWNAPDEELAKKCEEGLISAGFIKPGDAEGFLVVRRKNFYPRYSLDYEAELKKVMNEFKNIDNLILTGRIGMYNYNNADHCMDMGRFISDKLLDDVQPSRIIDDLERHVRTYRIVD